MRGDAKENRFRGNIKANIRRGRERNFEYTSQKARTGKLQTENLKIYSFHGKKH